MNIRDKLAAVKQSVRIVSVLKSHGVVVPNNTETQISCPFHGDDLHPSARVYAETNTLYCWTCHKMFDVIAVEMHFTGKGFGDAIDSLIGSFSVSVEESPAEIQRFYGLVSRYVHGDKRQSETLFVDFGYKFCRYYQSIKDWRNHSYIIDYFWNEYDRLYDSMFNSADTDSVDGLEKPKADPNVLIDKVAEWFANGHGALSTAVGYATAAMPAVSTVVDHGVEGQESDDSDIDLEVESESD